jgi:hypothetical protein
LTLMSITAVVATLKVQPGPGAAVRN